MGNRLAPPPSDRLDDIDGRDVVEVLRRGRDGPVPELPGDDPDVDALGPQLGGVGVAEAMGVDAALDPGLPAPPGPVARG